MKRATMLAVGFVGVAALVQAAPRKLNHIMIIWGENVSDVQARSQPYMERLADTYADFTNFKALMHPSQPNYLALACGETLVNTTVGCVDTPFPNRNLATLMEAAGLDWREYQEGMVTPCVDIAGVYGTKHDFLINFADVRTSPTLVAKDRGFQANDPSTYTELMGPNPPELVFVTPDLCNDAHDCGIKRFDQWLSGELGHTFFQDMLDSAYYNDGAIFISFDEDDFTPVNDIYCVAVSALARRGLQDWRPLNHYDCLRTIEDNFSLPTLTANDAAAQNMLSAFADVPPTPTPSPTPTPTGPSSDSRVVLRNLGTDQWKEHALAGNTFAAPTFTSTGGLGFSVATDPTKTFGFWQPRQPMDALPAGLYKLSLRVTGTTIATGKRHPELRVRVLRSDNKYSAMGLLAETSANAAVPAQVDVYWRSDGTSPWYVAIDLLAFASDQAGGYTITTVANQMIGP